MAIKYLNYLEGRSIMFADKFVDMIEQYVIYHQPFIKSLRAGLLIDEDIKYIFDLNLIYVVRSDLTILRIIDPANISIEPFDKKKIGDKFGDTCHPIDNFDTFLMPRNDYYICFRPEIKYIYTSENNLINGFFYNYDDNGSLKDMTIYEKGYYIEKSYNKLADDNFSNFYKAVKYIQELDKLSSKNYDLIKPA